MLISTYGVNILQYHSVFVVMKFSSNIANSTTGGKFDSEGTFGTSNDRH